MLTAALIGAIALAAAATAMAFWGMKRSFGYAEKLEEALVVNRLSEKQLAEALIAIAERDHSIDELTAQATRLRAALDIAEGETPPIVTKENAGASIRQSMDALRAGAVAASKTPLPSIFGVAAPPSGGRPPAAPGSVTGGLPANLPPAPVPGAPARPAAPGGPGGTSVHGAAAGPKPGSKPGS